MKLVTIITPAYNRANLLPNLFKSLKNQTNKDFEWLIVDDGSADNTEEVVKEFYNQDDFVVRYIKKENGGKHTALNVGIKSISTKYTFIVDSDDVLLPNAVEVIHEYDEKYGEREDISAYSFLKSYPDGKIVVSTNREEFVGSYIENRIKNNLPGDMAEVFITAVINKYEFPEFSNERFLSEDVLWIEIGKKYKYVFSSIPIYECEYLEGGLTANDKPIKFASPKGSMLRGKQLMYKGCGLKVNIKGAIIYNCYKIAATRVCDKCLKLSAREKLLVLITKPLGLVFYFKWRKN